MASAADQDIKATDKTNKQAAEITPTTGSMAPAITWAPTVETKLTARNLQPHYKT